MILTLSLASLLASPQSFQLDDSWTITIGNASAPVSSDGRWVVPNVIAADNFGVGGPGTSPDFMADDPVFVIASRIAPDGEPEWAVGAPFQFVDQATESFDQFDLEVTRTPPRIPQVLRTRPVGGSGVLTQIGDQLQLETWAMYGDRTSGFVNTSTDFTIYRTSNPDIVTVSSDGTVTAVGCGVATITANNFGVPAVTTIVVDEGAVLVDVEGICRVDGVDQPGAFVEIVGGTETASTGAGGRFDFSGVAVPATVGVRVRAEFSDGVSVWSGVSAAAVAVEGMVADVGIIELVEQTGLVNPGFETGTSSGYTFVGAASILTSLETVLPSEGLYMAELTTGLVGAGGGLTNDSITLPQERSTLAFDLNFLTDELDQASSFNDTIVITLIPVDGPPIELERLSVDDLRSGSIPTIPGPMGFDAQTGFRTLRYELEGDTEPGDVVQLNVALFNVGDSGGRSTALVDAFRWE